MKQMIHREVRGEESLGKSLSLGQEGWEMYLRWRKRGMDWDCSVKDEFARPSRKCLDSNSLRLESPMEI